MDNKKVISRSEMPARLPVGLTIALWLLMDRFDLGWLWGAGYFFLAIIWLATIHSLIVTDPVSVID